MGRPDVPVVCGASLGNTRYVALNQVPLPTVRPPVPSGSDAVADAVATVLGQHPTARWVGMGPLTNLAQLTRTRPDLASRLRLTQTGAAVNYRHPDRAEHNIRLDVAAARQVLATVPDPVFVLSDVTFTRELEIPAGSRLHQVLTDASHPASTMLRPHLQDWYDRFHPGTIQHDALTLTCALGLPFVDVHPHKVSFDGIGRLTLDEAGHRAWLSTAADYPSFNHWLHHHLVPAHTPASTSHKPPTS